MHPIFETCRSKNNELQNNQRGNDKEFKNSKSQNCLSL